MKLLVAIAFILILASLGSALFFLMRDKGQSNRTVHALARSSDEKRWVDVR